jgi:SHS2 domain-containing protein
VRGQTRAIDMEASVLEREVKAVTYHELAIREIDAGFELTYIVDI